MTLEIEVKLLIDENDTLNAEKVITNLEGAQFVDQQQLINQYFDTQDLQLRQWDMGLRIRQAGINKEQTIKTAGKVVGSLHQRPEYNVDIPINTAKPNLSLFPESIWPEKSSVSKTQSELVVLFETNFLRKKWYVQIQQTKIEAVLDIGEIIANSKRINISEIELELVEGDEALLLQLAEVIGKQVSVKPGSDSKAKRGYSLLSK